ncbi:MAG TPA: DUF4129 domain-containing protein [Candidatus Limnocylindrales bacterium]|nr:DUF4129 domain-containing protein [Candidatus Limnocylindrales bacterium]
MTPVAPPVAPPGSPLGSGTEASRRRPVARMIELAPVVLVVVAEAAWIAVLGGLLQEFTLRRAVLGLPVLAVFVSIGIAAARLLGPRLGDRWPIVALGIAGLGAAAGWALSEEARSAAGSGIGPAIAAHPGGIVAGLAVLRGYAHARLPLSESTVARLLSVGIPGIALVALLGGLIGEPLRSAFLGEALGAAVVFVAAAALALALVRLDDVGQDGGFDWRRNPPWLLLAVVVLIVAIVGAIPLAAVAGTVISVLISIALGPLLVFGLASGFDRTARRVILFFGLVIVILYALTNGPMRVTPPAATDPGVASNPPASTGEQVIAASLGGLLIVAALVAVVVLIALWMRRTPADEPAVDETRAIDRGGEPAGPARRRGRFGRRAEPATAVEAYVALVDELDRRPDVRREPAETPAGHAARLRSAGRSGLALDLLAADYALARYGGARLSASEDRRAIGRWRSLRRSLAHGPRARPGATAAEPAVPRTEMDAEGTRTGTRAM